MHEADFIKKKKIRAQRCSQKKNSCTGNRPKKKFLQAKNSPPPPPPPITFLMVHPLEWAKIAGRYSLNDKGRHSRVFADHPLQMNGFQNAKNTVKGRYAVPRKSVDALYKFREKTCLRLYLSLLHTRKMIAITISIMYQDLDF